MGAEDMLAHLGPLAITRTVATTWALMALLALAAWSTTRRLRVEGPGRAQAALEGSVLAIREAIEGVVPGEGERLLPFVGTLWLYIGAANLAGVVPGVSSPTADLSATAALALLVFLSVHWFGVRHEGLRGYLRHYLSPSPVMLPFHLVSEITRTVALAMRLFGNIMSLELAALLVLLVAGFLVPVPVLMLHIVEALVQAYIFGMLALVYIGGGLQARTSGAQAPQGEEAK
ncbi:MAG TPA: F0F1 ATP synthase subunit A, partial [Usitatibacter sp.]|nr:F0F1 ATP synthase subunit A [Usitatibacter sp.]